MRFASAARLMLVIATACAAHVAQGAPVPTAANYPTKPIRLIIPIVPSLPHSRAGKLKGLAMGTLKRSPLLPELPTLDELGISGYDAANWYSIATATGTPPATVKRLHAEIVNYLRQPETQKRITAMGADIDLKTPDEMRKIIPVEIEKWTKVAIAAGMPRE